MQISNFRVARELIILVQV